VSYHFGVILKRLQSQAEVFEGLRPVSRDLTLRNDEIIQAQALSSEAIDRAQREIASSRTGVRQAIATITEHFDRVPVTTDIFGVRRNVSKGAESDLAVVKSCDAIAHWT
jgi:hypothetical protein